MKKVKITTLFEIRYGNKLDLNKMSLCEEESSVFFIGRTAKNNGVVQKVKKLEGVEPFSAGLITVALGGSSLSTFLQPNPFYTAQNVAVLKPLIKLKENEKLYYCMALQANAYRYTACGREANRTLKDLFIPSQEEIPKWVNRINNSNFSKINSSKINKKCELPNYDKWEWFTLEELFAIKKGKRLTKFKMKSGKTPFIGSIDSNNGYRQYVSQAPHHAGNTITVNYNGSVAEAFYQPLPFWASDDVNVLYPKFAMDKYIALFIVTIIKKEKYRFSYGRKWHLERMNKSEIKLPVKLERQPDWEMIREYVQSLPFSAEI